MKPPSLPYPPIEGKTYTLFGDFSSTSDYYKIIKSLADRILAENDIHTVLRILEKYSARKRYLRTVLKKPGNDSLISAWLKLLNPVLKPFTQKAEEHLKTLSLVKFWDRRLATTEEQYHLYMLEIELINRLNKKAFVEADCKISLQPYCLQDFTAECRAAKTGFDFQCRSCSKLCFQNQASHILKDNGIEPYIWKGASIKSAAKEAYQNKQTFGILGVACIAELTWGMRKCMKYRIPVIGLPLNANRCVRWFGEFHPNSIDLEELEKLVSI